LVSLFRAGTPIIEEAVLSEKVAITILYQTF
jgi:hypothetical protein